MKNNGRLYNSIKNLTSGFISRIFIIILGMVVRTIFIKTLGNDYLSVNGLYSNILNMLSLAELGFGTAVVYSMYKPLSDNDQDKLASILDLYKKVYRIIGLVVLIIGLTLIPFLKFIIKDPPNINNLTFYYVLFLLNTVLSYWFFAYRSSILCADQKEYIVTNFHIVFNILKSAFQIVILLVFRNFTSYLLTQIAFGILENIAVAIYTSKHYEAFRKKKASKLPKNERRAIWKDVKALTMSKVGHIILNSTDNIIISTFVGISLVGILSNYTLITDAVTGILCTVCSAISASLGNYFVEKTKEEGYILFERVEFMNSWLYGFASVFLFVLLNPFITIWLGNEYIFDTYIVAAIVLNFFVQGYMNTLWTFRTTLGLFTQGWIRPIIVSLVNIIASIVLGIKFGIFGILFATFIARASVNLWYDPWIIHKYGFKKSVIPFFKMYFFRILQILSIIALISIIKYIFFKNINAVVSFVILMIISVIISISMFWIYSHKSDEFKYFCNIIKNQITVCHKR